MTQETELLTETQVS